MTVHVSGFLNNKCHIYIMYRLIQANVSRKYIKLGQKNLCWKAGK